MLSVRLSNSAYILTRPVLSRRVSRSVVVRSRMPDLDKNTPEEKWKELLSAEEVIPCFPAHSLL